MKSLIQQYSCYKQYKFKEKGSGCGDLVCNKEAVTCLQDMDRGKKGFRRASNYNWS